MSRLNITFVRPPVATPPGLFFFSLHETPDVRLVGAAPHHKTRVEKSNNVIFSSDLIATTLGMGQHWEMRFMSKTYLNSILLVQHSQASSSPLLPMHYYFYLLHFLTRQLRALLYVHTQARTLSHRSDELWLIVLNIGLSVANDNTTAKDEIFMRPSYYHSCCYAPSMSHAISPFRRRLSLALEIEDLMSQRKWKWFHDDDLYLYILLHPQQWANDLRIFFIRQRLLFTKLQIFRFA